MTKKFVVSMALYKKEGELHGLWCMYQDYEGAEEEEIQVIRDEINKVNIEIGALKELLASML